MNKNALMIAILIALAVPLAFAMTDSLTQMSGFEEPDLSCEMDFLSNTRIFIANASTMGLGLVCGDNAHILVYDCVDNDCDNLVPLEDGYKVNGELPYFEGFNVDDRYFYQCFECPSFEGQCPIVVNEGELVEIEWVGTDPDFDIGPQEALTYEFDGVIGADGTWQTQKGDAGIHWVSGQITDGEFTDSTELCIEVLKVNTPPQLTVPLEVTFAEGDTVSIKPECVDEDGDDLTVSFSGWMLEDDKVTGFNDAGDYIVRVTCEDQESSDGAEVLVTITNTNRAPELSVGDDVTVTETESVIVGAVCDDPDGDSTEIVYSGWMDSSQKLTDYGDAGEHEVLVTCSDEYGASDADTVAVTVLAKNRAPQMNLESAVTFYEGELVTLDPQCVDPDGDPVTVEYSGWMDSATYQTNYEDAGTYSVSVVCTDTADLATEEIVTVTVLNRNRPPKIAWKQKE